jgi:hypothetical protein
MDKGRNFFADRNFAHTLATEPANRCIAARNSTGTSSGIAG